MTGKKGFTIGKARKGLYAAGKVLGDINAANRGTLPARIGTRVIGPLVGRAFGALIRGLFGRR